VRGFAGAVFANTLSRILSGRLSDPSGYARRVAQTSKLSAALSPSREWLTKVSCPGSRDGRFPNSATRTTYDVESDSEDPPRRGNAHPTMRLDGLRMCTTIPVESYPTLLSVTSGTRNGSCITRRAASRCEGIASTWARLDRSKPALLWSIRPCRAVVASLPSRLGRSGG